MGAPAARVSELSRHWVDSGHKVTVLTGFPNHPDGVLRPEYRKHFRRGVFRERLHGIDLIRTWLLPFPNRKAHERILNYSSFCLSACATGSFLPRPDIVIATSPQLLVGLAGRWISKIKNVPFVLEIRDLWPESLSAVGIGGEHSLLHRTLARVTRFLYREADHLVVVSPAFRERLIENWRVPAEKISVIQNGVETELFNSRAADGKLRATLNAQNRFVASYIGTLGLAQGLELLIEAAEKLQVLSPQVLFLLVGDGADRERLMTLAKTKKLTNVEFVPQQPRQSIPAYICASDACLVLLKKSEVFETVIPSKMLEFMSCGRPVILGVDGHARRIIESSRSGIYVPPENADALCSAIVQLQHSPGLRDELGRNGREYIVQNLSRGRTAAEYLNLMERLLSGDVHASQAAAA
ncbi:MAG TPA: glycosyltransferase family 4 protein [Terriglobales bacterium]|nr:glycosyltransferase family 4 protein [Terriglobales bacterium]